jgi:uncharacterized protein (TIGR02145 family)
VNYQAVALTAGGQTVKNQAIKLRLSIVDSSATGTVLYTETHQPTTDGAGQFSVFLGGGNATVGTFSNIAWSNGKDKFLKAEADVTGGTNYVLMGSSQIVSVPYAIHAKTATKMVDSLGNEFEIEYQNGAPIIKNKSNSSKPSNSTSVSCGQNVLYGNELYPTVQIGNQCWFAKNLNIGEMIFSAREQLNNSAVEKFCQENNVFYCIEFGGLYQWAEAVQYQNGATNLSSPNPVFSGNIKGICPLGWHIPSNNDFCILATQMDPSTQCTLNGGNSNSANQLKSPFFWYLNNFTLNNAFNFSAIPAGYRQSNYYFGNLYYETYYWTTSFSNNSSDPVIWEMKNQSSYFNRNNGHRFNGYSVRCLKD